MTADRPQISAGRRRLRLFLAALVLLALGWQLAAFFLGRSLTTALAAYQGPSLALEDYVPPLLPAGQPNGWDTVAAVQLLAEGQTFSRQVASASPRIPPELPSLQKRFRELERSGERPSAADLDFFRAILTRLELPLAVLQRSLEEAAEARYDTDYNVLAPMIEVPNHLFSLRLTGLLRAEAEVAAAEGRTADAWKAAKGLYRLAYWNATSTTFLISGIVARAIAQQGADTVQTLLAVAPGDAAMRAEVLAEATRLAIPEHFDRVFAAEKAAMYSGMLDPRFGSGPYDQGPEAAQAFSPNALLADWEPWRRYNAARYLTFTTAANAHCSLPTYRQGSDGDHPSPPQLPAWLQPAALLTFDCRETSQKRDLWRASIDQLEIALALEDFRERSGRYPQTLAEAGGSAAARTDPFSGKPYLYRPEGRGYLLYSVSLDGQDDGGQRTFTQGDQIELRSGDWVWEVRAAVTPGPSASP